MHPRSGQYLLAKFFCPGLAADLDRGMLRKNAAENRFHFRRLILGRISLRRLAIDAIFILEGGCESRRSHPGSRL